MASVFLLPSATLRPNVDAPLLSSALLLVLTLPGHILGVVTVVTRSPRIPVDICHPWHSPAVCLLFARCDCRWWCVSEEFAKFIRSLTKSLCCDSPLAPKKQCVENQREAGFCAIIVLSLAFLCHCLVTVVISSWLRAQNGKLFPIVSKKQT